VNLTWLAVGSQVLGRGINVWHTSQLVMVVTVGSSCFQLRFVHSLLFILLSSFVIVRPVPFARGKGAHKGAHNDLLQREALVPVPFARGNGPCTHVFIAILLSCKTVKSIETTTRML
jgi:hypothetical protein